MNREWHKQHVMPKRATLEQRIAWHRAHQEACGCRPIPAGVARQMGTTTTAAKPARAATASKRKDETTKDTRAAAAAADFAAVARAFDRDDDVDVGAGGRGFGAGALKVNGKIFAMISAKGEFVVKLPKSRVDDLVRAEQGAPFSPGPGRVMKEWLAVRTPPKSWVAFAKEARKFVAGS